MCYEMGKIYRDDWSHSDAEKLAATLRTRGSAWGGLAGAAIGHFIPFIGGPIGTILGAAFGAFFASRDVTEASLLSTSKSIIDNFEAAHETATAP
jgi:uncharacterized protein (DUF697 family)